MVTQISSSQFERVIRSIRHLHFVDRRDTVTPIRSRRGVELFEAAVLGRAPVQVHFEVFDGVDIETD